MSCVSHQMVNVMTRALIGLAVLLSLLPAMAMAGEPPIKEIVSGHIGWETDTTTGGKVCPTTDTCQPGNPSSEAGGFLFPSSVAGAPTPAGDFYVADAGNHRIQEFTAAGGFILMFGREVNKNGGDLCTKAEESKCKAGVEGSAAGQLESPQSLAVDSNGDVYVAELTFGQSGGQVTFGERVQKFTGQGRFVLEIGKEVNATNSKNLCTAEEQERGIARCKGPKMVSAFEELPQEPGAFRFEAEKGIVAAGGHANRLYVGEEHGVQEFEANGDYVRQISLTSVSAEPDNYVKTIQVGSDGNLYLIYVIACQHCGVETGVPHDNVIREFDEAGQQINEFVVQPREPGSSVFVGQMALDPSDRVAVTEDEGSISRGSLYEFSAPTLHLITQFATSAAPAGLGFNSEDRLYAVAGQEAIAYEPVAVGEPVLGSAQCAQGADVETNATFNCLLQGEVNPWGVAGTVGWFQWGRTPAFGSETSKQTLCTTSCGTSSIPLTAEIAGARPNDTLYDRVAAEDQNVRAPEVLVSETVPFKTPTVAPRVVDEPRVSYIRPFSAVMSGEVNPENDGIEYFFEYGACERIAECPSTRTKALRSSVYGPVAVTLEAGGLQPHTVYSYRLNAVNEAGQTAADATGREPPEEGIFETLPTPTPQAITGDVSAVTATGAVISGTVNPDGQAATYAFEVGIYNGSATRYGVVFSASTDAGREPVLEALALSGLQPGTPYAYRITVQSAFGVDEGAPRAFTTQGLPEVLVVPAAPSMLAIPPGMSFPRSESHPAPCKRGYRRDKHGKCIKVRHKRPRRGGRGKRVKRR